MKIVVAGSGGRLGAALARIYGEGHEVTALDREAMDLGDGGAVRRALEPLDFEVLVNAAALTNVDYCEDHEEEAFAVNARGVGVVAGLCSEKGARMIHVSTDYVFAGEAEGERRETDPVGPRSVYGRSKLAGEEAVLEVDGDFLVARTSWVFGPDRPSFLDFILDQALEKERVEAIEDKWSTPTYTVDFASLLEPLLSPGVAGGILHLCNRGSCSWREYGQAALDSAAELGLPLKTGRVEGIRLSGFSRFVAPRPVHTSMSTERYRELAGEAPRRWEEAVEAFVRDDYAPRRAGKSGG